MMQQRRNTPFGLAPGSIRATLAWWFALVGGVGFLALIIAGIRLADSAMWQVGATGLASVLSQIMSGYFAKRDEPGQESARGER